MRNEKIQVLLIEDDFRFAELLGIWLEEISESDCVNLLTPAVYLQHVDNLTEGLSWLKNDSIDIVLTDLNLLDSQGLVTCERLLAHAGDIPIIVLSGLDDETLAIQAMSLGAQDYLLKNLLDGRLLLRSIRYALERSRLQRELAQMRQIQLQQREQEILDRINERSGASMATAQVLGLRSIEQTMPELFARMAERLTTIWEQVIEMRTYKVVHNISQDLRELAWELGLYKCSPRDVVALYRAVLIQMERPEKPRRNELVHEEGLYVAFELMGHLVSYYRPYALGASFAPRDQVLH